MVVSGAKVKGESMPSANKQFRETMRTTPGACREDKVKG